MNTLGVIFGAASMFAAYALAFGTPLWFGVSGAVAAASFIAIDLRVRLKGDQ